MSRISLNVNAFRSDGKEFILQTKDSIEQKTKIVQSLEELKRESIEIESNLKEIMKAKAAISDRKSAIDRKIKNMTKLRDEAEKRLGGYSYKTIADSVIFIYKHFATGIMWVNPNVDNDLKFRAFGFDIDLDELYANIAEDSALINATIDVMGGELIMLYRKTLNEHHLSGCDIEVAKSQNALGNKRKRFTEKLLHPKVKAETIKYKTAGA